ncbi:MAG: SAM-dependent methyltransferase [Bacteroidetes bacterium]|nr:SAM-dependent methyltransferase [Bacteroidota bacterium]
MMNADEMHVLPSSFRDPAGFMCETGGEMYRVVTTEGREDVQHFFDSGLYDELGKAALILPHEQVSPSMVGMKDDVRVLRTNRLPFFSYPYEWSYAQFRDAALLTLDVTRRALNRGMILKDASAFNVSFHGTHAYFVDMLSFTRYTEGAPWLAYRQFCEHFLAPLLLSDYSGGQLFTMLQSHVDGIPLGIAASLLPLRSRFRFSESLHVHAHASGIRRFSVTGSQQARQRSTNVGALVESLWGLVSRLPRRRGTSGWSDYYDSTVYSDSEEAEKEQFVRTFIEEITPSAVWDLGSNTGRYARIASELGISTVAMDADPAVVDRMYQEGKARDDRTLLPLVMNIAQPSPRLGWAHEERASLQDRGPVDAALYLGIVHHLRFTHTIPLGKQIEYLAAIARNVVFEWIPPDDINVRRMIAGTVKEFLPYSIDILESELRKYFSVEKRMPVGSTGRLLHHLRLLPVP